jgi:hypothetical protein
MTRARPLGEGTGATSGPASRSQRTAQSRPKPYTGCPALHVELYRHTARLRGAHILQLLDEAGVQPRMYDRANGCWTIPLSRADDVICVAEYQQRRFVTVAEVDQ